MSDTVEHAFAVVDAVHADGLSLRFDGEETAGEKHYKCNTFFKFAAGDRVYCVKDSGTFVAICKIGEPAQTIAADTAETAETAESAKEADAVTRAAEALKLILKDYYYGESATEHNIRVRYNRAYSVIEFCLDEASYGNTWLPFAGVADEAAASDSAYSSRPIRFRSTSAGKLEYLVPLRSNYTWHTIEST